MLLEWAAKESTNPMASHPEASDSSITAAIDGLSLDDLRARQCEKWNTYPADVLPAWVAEMDFPIAEPIARVLQDAVDRREVGDPAHRVRVSDEVLTEVAAGSEFVRFEQLVDRRPRVRHCRISTGIGASVRSASLR